MKNSTLSNNRGSALVLALIVTLALTAIGIATVNSVMETAKMTGAHRVQSQAVALTESATTYTGTKASRAPKGYIQAMENNLDDKLQGKSGSVKDELENQGPFIKFSSSGSSSGVLSISAGDSFEAQQDSKVNRIIRNPITIKAPGFGGDYCFKKVIIASESVMGNCQDASKDYICGGFNSVQPVAKKQSYMEALLGPLDC